MAWTHFTAPLADGDLLTKAMVAELLSALNERLQAVNSGWSVLSAGAEETALRASNLETRRVYYTGPGGTNVLSDLHTVIQGLSTSYLRPKFVESGSGTSGSYSGSAVLEEALTDLGESAANLSAWTGTALSTRVYWNMVREAIRLLRWVQVGDFAGATRYSRGTGGLFEPNRDFAEALAYYPTVAEVSSATSVTAFLRLRADQGPSIPDSPRYVLSGQRAAGTGLTVPATAPWTSAAWELALRPTYAVDPSSSTYLPLVGQVQLGADSWIDTPSGAAGVAAWYLPGETSMLTGSQAIGIRLKGYDDGSQFDEMDAVPWTPDGTGDETKFVGTLFTDVAVAGKPTFTYP